MNQKPHIKFKQLAEIMLAGIVAFFQVSPAFMTPAQAESCPALKVVFARGSGEKRWEDQNFLSFKDTLGQKLSTVDLNYEFVDLDYPAVGIDNLNVALGAFISGGEAYEFGDSIDNGVNKLVSLVNNPSCKQTKYVIAGYSQGAMVVSKALDSLNADRIIYAATFGDPKIYLPEGAGPMPVACQGMNLSNYRMYVPDCQAYKGLLGAYIPYQPEVYVDKLGTWCNKMDIFCSSHFSITNHVSYVADGLYEDASRVIFDKITRHFGLEKHVSSPHDTAILIDSTGSMTAMIEDFKNEALRLAQEIFNIGGRVALYDYRDLEDPYEVTERCNFDTCTLDNFEEELANITTDGGGDERESLLSSSFNVMKALKWKLGSTKSLVVLTDAGFLEPDRDGITIRDVVDLSKRIDPVNFYIVTNKRSAGFYTELASLTDGKVVTDFDELSLLTDYIIGRYDSLPRVEETNELIEKPHLEIIKSEQKSVNEITISFKTNGEKTIVILNDAVLGLTSETEITINDLASQDNEIVLVPIRNELRGDRVVVNVQVPSGHGDSEAVEEFIPKTPNTGRQ